MDPSKPSSADRNATTLPPKPPEAEWTVPRYVDGTGPCRVATSLDDDDPRCRVARPPLLSSGTTDGCVMVVYTRQRGLLGKRFALAPYVTRVGRRDDNDIVLDGNAVSRRHAHFERHGDTWRVVDDGSTNGTERNDQPIALEGVLKNGDRVSIGTTIFKFLSGPDVETAYVEELERLLVTDGLTQIHNRRSLHETLDRERIRSRRDGRDLAVLLLGVDHLARVDDEHGILAGDFVLKDLTRVVLRLLRPDHVFARYGGDVFAIVLPGTSLEGAIALGERLRPAVREHLFLFQGKTIRVTLSGGAAQLEDRDHASNHLLKRAWDGLTLARSDGRDRIHR